MDRRTHKSALMAALSEGRVSDARALQAYVWSRGWTVRAMRPGASVMPRATVRAGRGGNFQVTTGFALDTLEPHPPGTWTYALLASGDGAKACHIGQTHALLRQLSKQRGRLMDWADARGVPVQVILLEYRARTGVNIPFSLFLR